MRRNPSRRPCRRKALSATSDGQLGSTMRRKRRFALCSMAFAAKPRSPSFAGAKALPVAETERQGPAFRRATSSGLAIARNRGRAGVF